MPDIRRVFLDTLMRYGHNVYLQRRIGETEGAQPRPIYSTTLEKYTCRMTYPRTGGLSGAAEEQLEGIVVTVDIVFYFQHSVNPREGDRIYEFDPRYPDDRHIWRIDYAHPMRGRGGRIEYWVAGATRWTQELT